MGDRVNEPSASRVRHRLGMSRRDLLRRGAVVGGTLIWTIPVVKTLSSAHPSTGSPLFGCCECRKGPAGKKKCTPGTGHIVCYDEAESCQNCTQAESKCQAWCKQQGRAYCFHTSPQSITCSSIGHGGSRCVGSANGGVEGDA
jgi:hypothetical protein